MGEDGVGIANQKCVITAADGSKHNGKTDAKGVLRIEGVPEGKCKVEFVDLDKDALA